MAVEGVGREKVVAIETLRRLREGAAAADSTASAGQARNAEASAQDATKTDGPGSREQLLVEFKRGTAELPDVRNDKVIEAKLRISTGYYDRPEVRRQILRSLLMDLLPSSAVPAPAEEVEPE